MYLILSRKKRIPEVITKYYIHSTEAPSVTPHQPHHTERRSTLNVE